MSNFKYYIMEIVQRIKELIKVKELTVNSFSKEIGIGQVTLNNYIRLNRYPAYETLHAILTTFTDVSAEWLMRGEGSMFVSDRLPVMRGDETDSEEDLHVLLAQKEAELEDLKMEKMRMLGQLEFMEEYNIKIAGKLSRTEKELETLRGSNKKKDIG